MQCINLAHQEPIRAHVRTVLSPAKNEGPGVSADRTRRFSRADGRRRLRCSIARIARTGPGTMFAATPGNSAAGDGAQSIAAPNMGVIGELGNDEGIYGVFLLPTRRSQADQRQSPIRLPRAGPRALRGSRGSAPSQATSTLPRWRKSLSRMTLTSRASTCLSRSTRRRSR